MNVINEKGSNKIVLNYIEKNNLDNISTKDNKIKQVAQVILKILGATLAVAVALVLTAAFLPFSAISAALEIFKGATVISGFAIGTFAVTKLLDAWAPKLPKPLRVVANTLHCAMTEILSTLAMSALFFINLEKKDPKNVESNPQRPILLIHGLYHNSSAWIYYQNKLKEAGVGPVFTINLGNNFGSSDDHAEKVKAKVAEIQRITGRQDIMLIGHSKGGIVASKFALELADEETIVTDIITIGSPLEGTYVAPIGIGKGCKEMRYQSDYMKDLGKKICEQNRIQFFHIGTAMDELVIPASSALLQANMKAQRLSISNLGHNGLLYSDRVIDSIIEYYKNKDPMIEV